MDEIILEARDITKDFPGVRALDGVSFVLRRGDIHALCGENGAGKSTLINVLSGFYPFGSYSGEIFLDGQKQTFGTIREAEQAGIAVIHQELSLFPELTVTENIFVGHELQRGGILDWNRMFAEAEEWITKLKLEGVAPTTKIKDLGVARQQLVEIARVLRLQKIKILILDEPTASLTEYEVDLLLGILRQLRESGITCVYISHRIEEVMAIADYVTILRDGKAVGGRERVELKKKDIVRMMVGREITDYFPKQRVPLGENTLEVRGVSVLDSYSGKPLVQDASFHLRRSEILGLFGLVGAGRTELVSTIFGARMGETHGEVILEGRPARFLSPGAAIGSGLALVTEDRKALGIISTMNVKENSSIAHIRDFSTGLGIDSSREVLAVKGSVESLNVKTPSLDTIIVNLSGGNQQKVLLSRSLLKKVTVLILDEPTRGIDVGAKQEIYQIMGNLVRSGVSIIMVSSELPEILGMCDRILVMCRGAITGEFDNTESTVTQEDIMICATGTGSEE
ncbi:MAG: ATP-binding cassette domain-containing protein [Spirochaetales bacterium]|nr:ATP-binding cassette domain-containing protein [Spirochaetales bacterium]